MLLVGNGLNLEALKEKPDLLSKYKQVLDKSSAALTEAVLTTFKEKGTVLSIPDWGSLDKNLVIGLCFQKGLCQLKLASSKNLGNDPENKLKKRWTDIAGLVQYFLSIWQIKPNYETLCNLVAAYSEGILKDVIIQTDLLENELMKSLILLMGKNGMGDEDYQRVSYNRSIKDKLNSYDIIATTNYDDWIKFNCSQFSDDAPLRSSLTAHGGHKLVHLHGSIAARNIAAGPIYAKSNVAKLFRALFSEGVSELDIFGLDMVNELHLCEVILKIAVQKDSYSIKKIRHYIHDKQNEKRIDVIAENYHSGDYLQIPEITLAIARLREGNVSLGEANGVFYEILPSAKWRKTPLEGTFEAIRPKDD